MTTFWITYRHTIEKKDILLSHWTTQVKKTANFNQWCELQLARAKAKSIVYKLYRGIPQSSIWKAVTERGYSPVANKMYASTRTDSMLQAANATLQEYILRSTD